MGMTIIIGEPGAGKTALLSRFLADFIENGFDRYISCKREINKLNEGGFINLEPPPLKHTCYADFDFKINRRIKAYSVSGFEIGLPNPYFKTRYFAPYSIFFLDEAQKYFDSRMSKYIREEVYRWFQLHRHNHYEIYMTCQRLGNIDVNIRSIADKYIYVEGCEVKEDKYGQIINVTWKVREFKSCDTAEQYMMARERKEISKLGESITYKTDLPIFNYYDSYGCKPAFYRNLENYNNIKFEYFTENGYQFTLESFVEFNETHYFVAPEGYYKNFERDKKILEEKGIA